MRNLDTLSPVAVISETWKGMLFDEDGWRPFWQCDHDHHDLDSAEDCANSYLKELTNQARKEEQP